MTFTETLRRARDSRVTVLQEFYSRYNPEQSKIHAFFEGHDDIAFFAPHIERQLPAGFALCSYRCDRKALVMEVFEAITTRMPDIAKALFFVDKDIDDIRGIPWPTDPRIFVTDVYSIDNYCVSSTVLLRLYRHSVKLTKVDFDEAAIVAQFESQLAIFHRQLVCVMAWILVCFRQGLRPHLSNVAMDQMWRFTATGEVRAAVGDRQSLLEKFTGVQLSPGSFRRLREATRELSHSTPKRIVRGKYELWFLVAFWKHLTDQLCSLAAEGGGKAKVQTQLTLETAVSITAPHTELPRSLELFLSAHFAAKPIRAIAQPLSAARPWWKRIFVTVGLSAE